MNAVKLAADMPIRDQVDLDSFDFLNFLVALHRELGVDIPEADYGKLTSIDAAIDYLAAKIGSTSVRN